MGKPFKSNLRFEDYSHKKRSYWQLVSQDLVRKWLISVHKKHTKKKGTCKGHRG